jgi:hypothetical protein
MPHYEGSAPLGSSRRRWEDNIQMGVKKVGFERSALDPFGSEYGSTAFVLVKTTTASIKYGVSWPAIYC